MRGPGKAGWQQLQDAQRSQLQRPEAQQAYTMVQADVCRREGQGEGRERKSRQGQPGPGTAANQANYLAAEPKRASGATPALLAMPCMISLRLASSTSPTEGSHGRGVTLAR